MTLTGSDTKWLNPARCPTCNAVIASYDYQQDFMDKPNLVRAWAGGPLVNVPTYVAEIMPVPGSQRYTFHPCQHEYRGTLTVYTDGSQTWCRLDQATETPA